MSSNRLRLSVRDDSLSFATDGITMTEGTPSVTVLLNAEEAPVTIRPAGAREMRLESRRTPIGIGRAITREWCDPRGLALSWTITRLRRVPGFTLQAALTNRSSTPVRLREFTLCDTPDGALRCEGNPADWWLQTYDYGRRNANLATDLPSLREISRMPSGWTWLGHYANRRDETWTDGHWRLFPDFATLYSDEGRRGITMAAVGPAESSVRIACRIVDGAVRLGVYSEMSDVTVDLGETRTSEEVLFLAEPYDRAATAVFRWIAATHGARTDRGPIFGWCSWYLYTTNIDESKIGGLITAYEETRDRLPLQVIQIDDGWQKDFGDWRTETTKFPHGMKPLADRIRATGAIPGIWMAPLCFHEGVPHPDGTTGGHLDPTHPASKDFIREAVSARVQDGYRYFKFDFNETAPTRHDPKKTEFQALRDAFRLYRETIGEDAYLLACTCFRRFPIGIADGMRIGPDSSPVWDRPAAADGISQNPLALKECLRAVGSTALANGLLFASDPDVTYTRAPGEVTEDERRTWHSMVGLLGGFMMTSDPLDQPEFRADEDAIRMMEILWPPAPDKGRSLAAATDPWHRRFGFIARRRGGRFASMLLHNPLDAPADVALAVPVIEALGPRFHAWSFWDSRYLGELDATFVARELAPHACLLLRLTPMRNDERPVLVGSDLHIAMGSAEIGDFRASAGGVKIVLNDAGARSGNLYVWSSRPLALRSANSCTASVAACHPPGLWRISLSDREPGTGNVLRLRFGDG